MTKKTPQEILKKPYARILIPEEAGGFSAEILEFPGCYAQGETPNETFEALERAAESWIEAAIEQGQEIPDPFNNQGYGGRIALRLPRSMHKQAARMADRDDISLNQFLLSAVATRVGAESFYDYLIEKLRTNLLSVTYQLNQLNVFQIKEVETSENKTIGISPLKLEGQVASGGGA